MDSVERRSVQRGLDFIIRRFNVVDVFNPNAQLWLLGNLKLDALLLDNLADLRHIHVDSLKLMMRAFE